MKVVYIAHPLGRDPERRKENCRAAAKWVAFAATIGYAPIADWITLAGELPESYRELGLAIDCCLVERCDEVWLCGPHVSPGMVREAWHALWVSNFREKKYTGGIAVYNYTGLTLEALTPSKFEARRRNDLLSDNVVTEEMVRQWFLQGGSTRGSPQEGATP